MGAFLNAINEYGVLTFVVAFAAFIIWSIVKQWLDSKSKKVADENERTKESARIKAESDRIDREDKRYDKLCESINNLSNYITRSSIHTAEEQEEDLKFYNLVQDELDELIRGGAQHAYYFLFHNGGRDVLGHGMLKMTMCAESNADGKSRMKSYQEVPRSIMPILYGRLASDGDYYINNVEDILKSDIKTYSFLKENDSKCALFKAIKRSDGLIAGFLGIEFNDVKKNLDKEKKDISRKADRIAGARSMCAAKGLNESGGVMNGKLS